MRLSRSTASGEPLNYKLFSISRIALLPLFEKTRIGHDLMGYALIASESR